MNVTRRVLFFAFAGVASAQKPAEPTGEEPVPTFSTGVSLVKVDAKVTRRDGRPVTDLRQSDFIVYDEEVPQEITHFAAESDPTQVLLLLDVSASMLKSLSAMSARAREALGMLGSGDQVGVMLFASRSNLLQPFTSQFDGIPAKISGSIYKETLGRASLLNDALSAAARYFEKHQGSGRRSVIVVTDNQVGRNQVSDEETVRALHAADAVMNAIIIGSEPAEPRKGGRYDAPGSLPPDVFRFAQQTGGEVVADADAAAALKRMLERLNTRYSLHYVAPPGEPGTFRRIRVDLSPSASRRYPDAVVQARSGYEVGR